MPIKFPCPHCKKVLSVKDHLAGKKGACPSCKKILSVPLESSSAIPTAPKSAPTPTNGQSNAKEPKSAEKPSEPQPPPVDAEAAAAAAFADEPPPVEETAAPAFIDFNCPQCDEPLHLSADLAGKRAPCPECKRIVKVPEIKKVEKVDWRKTNAQGLPSGARRPDEPVPEGAWGTATSATNVSRTALEEAKVIPDRYWQPLTTQQKVMRYLLAAGGLVFLGIVIAVAVGWWLSTREARAVKSVEDYANSPGATEKIGREGQAALFIALGEYHLHTKRPECAKEAENMFNKAIETLTPSDNNAVKANERDAILADLALLQIELAGTKDEIDQKTRLKWDEAQNAIRKTLHAMKNREARLDAFRAVFRRMIAMKENKRAMALARQISDDASEKAEILAVAGLELLTAKQPGMEELSLEMLEPFESKDKRPFLTSPVVALADALNKKVEMNPDPDYKFKTQEEENALIGHAEAQARKGGDLGEARKSINSLEEKPIVRLRGFIAMAVAGETKSDNADLQAAIKLAMDARIQSPDVAWLQLRVVDLAAHAGVGDDQLNALAAAIQDPNLSGRARLLVLRQKMADKNAAAQAPLPAEPPTLSHYLSVQLLARHKHSFDAGNADDADRAFGVIGELIGKHSK